MLIAAIKNTPRLLRAIALLAATSLVLFAFLIASRVWVLQPLLDSQRASVTFSTGGGLILTGRDVTKAQVLLPASSDWIDTGVIVEAGDEIRFTAWGHAHLAINHANQSAITDEPPLFSWLGPEGELWVNARPRDEHRRDALLYNRGNNNSRLIGQVLGAVIPADAADPSIRGGNPRPQEMFEIGRGRTYVAKSDGAIWLVLNDIVFDETAESAYVGPDLGSLDKNMLIAKYPAFGSEKDVENAISRRAGRLEKWSSVKLAEAWDLFYVDNIGTHLVQFEIR